eukprot:TRINITY_DN9604_c0_g1_i8.p1 TRINITY_DN9604_c0_g1~~TRINITY_DN9604_c0_g1_i8.p1  ORF type:complete len:824 (+),score=293.42 TRINITY_DN9604_c0_g1_i8:77-2473(+)
MVSGGGTPGRDDVTGTAPRPLGDATARVQRMMRYSQSPATCTPQTSPASAPVTAPSTCPAVIRAGLDSDSDCLQSPSRSRTREPLLQLKAATPGAPFSEEPYFPPPPQQPHTPPAPLGLRDSFGPLTAGQRPDLFGFLSDPPRPTTKQQLPAKKPNAVRSLSGDMCGIPSDAGKREPLLDLPPSLDLADAGLGKADEQEPPAAALPPRTCAARLTADEIFPRGGDEVGQQPSVLCTPPVHPAEITPARRLPVPASNLSAPALQLAPQRCPSLLQSSSTNSLSDSSNGAQVLVSLPTPGPSGDIQQLLKQPTQPAEPQMPAVVLKALQAQGLQQPRQPCSLSDYARTHQGSRSLQDLLASPATPEAAVDAVFDEARPDLQDLMRHMFGNFVVQSLYSRCTPDRRKILAGGLFGNVQKLAFCSYGCRVLQVALRYIDEAFVNIVTQELEPIVLRCIQDQNGNHVVQKCVEVLPGRVGWIVSKCAGSVVRLATHSYGCRVLQRLFEFTKDTADLEELLQEVVQNVPSLVKNAFGNYVVQHAIIRGDDNLRLRIYGSVQNNLVEYSSDKYASNVVEKLFASGSSAIRTPMLQRLTAGTPSPLSIMIDDHYANFVVQKILREVSDSERAAIVSHLTPLFPKLSAGHFSGPIIARLQRGELPTCGKQKKGPPRRDDTPEQPQPQQQPPQANRRGKLSNRLRQRPAKETAPRPPPQPPLLHPRPHRQHLSKNDGMKPAMKSWGSPSLPAQLPPFPYPGPNATAAVWPPTQPALCPAPAGALALQPCVPYPAPAAIPLPFGHLAGE